LLEKLFRDELRRRGASAVKKLTGFVSQRRLEVLLGLSQGYLCKVAASKASPSAELVTHLANLATEPATRLQELERFWTDPPEKDLPDEE
jgi:transcriptional regulator with XRE-family HTH domain